RAALRRAAVAAPEVEVGRARRVALDAQAALDHRAEPGTALCDAGIARALEQANRASAVAEDVLSPRELDAGLVARGRVAGPLARGELAHHLLAGRVGAEHGDHDGAEQHGAGDHAEEPEDGSEHGWQAPVSGTYSVRNASTGSTREARSAGM